MAVKELAKAGAGVANQVPGGAIGVGLIILGSALALIGSIAVEFVRGWASDRRKARTVVGMLLAEIESIVVGLGAAEKGASEHEASEMLISEIQPAVEIVRSALRRLDHYRDGILLIKKKGLRRDLPAFLLLVEVACAETMVKDAIPTHQIIEAYGKLGKAGSRLLEQLRELKA